MTLERMKHLLEKTNFSEHISKPQLTMCEYTKLIHQYQSKFCKAPLYKQIQCMLYIEEEMNIDKSIKGALIQDELEKFYELIIEGLK